MNQGNIETRQAFAALATLITWFSAVRRRVERELRQARDDLEIEVIERTRRLAC
jgi:hypothetical protein